MAARRQLAILAAMVAAVLLHGAGYAAAQDNTLTVFAAASLRNALDDVDAAFTRKSATKVVASYAASSALAKQIAQGAPADVYISANTRWMDFLARQKLIEPATRVDLLGNALVLIAPKASKLDRVGIGEGFAIAKLAGNGRIAVADVQAVPAGLYAKAALQSLGAWRAAEPKLAQAENVRATLAFVARGETPLGIVYATDAKVEPKVKVIGTFPENSHPPIIYPLAAMASSRNPSVATYLRFMRSTAARAIFERYGFTVLAQPAS